MPADKNKASSWKSSEEKLSAQPKGIEKLVAKEELYSFQRYSMSIFSPTGALPAVMVTLLKVDGRILFGYGFKFQTKKVKTRHINLK